MVVVNRTEEPNLVYDRIRLLSSTMRAGAVVMAKAALRNKLGRSVLDDVERTTMKSCSLFLPPDVLLRKPLREQ